MGERIQQEYPFKAEKIVLIKKLEDPERKLSAFVGLCELFSKSWDLSKNQGRALVQNLQGGGFINYVNEWAERDLDFEKANGAWWDIEFNGDTQVTAMRVAHDLLSATSPEQEAELAVSLLNAGHMLGTLAFGWRGDTLKYGADSLQAFSETETRALEMLKGGKSCLQRLAINNGDLDEFRRSAEFDYWLIMAVEPGVLNLGDEKDLLTLYKRALDIIYIGYGMAMRDVPITEARYWESLGY